MTTEPRKYTIILAWAPKKLKSKYVDERVSMKKIIFAVCLLACQSAVYAAQGGRRFGAGIILGAPTGLSAKYWLDKTRAVDGALGFEIFLSMRIICGMGRACWGSPRAAGCRHIGDSAPRSKAIKTAPYSGSVR